VGHRPEGGMRGTSATLRPVASPVVTSSMCPDCGHAWDMHPGAVVSVTHCLDCIIEEDHDAREIAEMCSRVPPYLEHVPVGDALVARYKRRLLRATVCGSSTAGVEGGLTSAAGRRPRAS
jgi:hypothetical protein